MKEAILAFRINANYSKNEILEQYLNTVYFGQGSYGVKAAAERMFIAPDPETGAPVTKNLSQLTIADSALLAGLIANPNGNNPFSNPAGALAAAEPGRAADAREGLHHPEEAAAAVATPAADDHAAGGAATRQLLRAAGAGPDPRRRREQVRARRRRRARARAATSSSVAVCGSTPRSTPRCRPRPRSAIRDTLPEDTNGATAALVAMDPAERRRARGRQRPDVSKTASSTSRPTAGASRVPPTRRSPWPRRSRTASRRTTRSTAATTARSRDTRRARKAWVATPPTARAVSPTSPSRPPTP